MNKSLKRKIFRWGKVLIMLYCGIGIALFYLQDYFLFHPEIIASDYEFRFDKPFEEINIPFNKTDTINLVKFYPKDSVRRGVVLYFHGNKQNILRYHKFTDNFTKNGYEVWMEDYPGFGKSTGERTEKKLYEQAKAIYGLAASKYKSDSIIIFGKSFGTGIASYVAAEKKCQQLILETPYYSIPALFGSYAPIYPVTRMSTYKIPTYNYLQLVQVPVTIFHGTDDGVIPYSNASRLKSVLKSTDEFITIKNGTHHNLNDFPLFHKVLDSLLK